MHSPSPDPDAPSSPSSDTPARPRERFEPLGPVAGKQRIDSIDILRGLAVLGILAMNIGGFVMPLAAYTNPKIWGGDGVNIGVWFFNHFFFDQKFLPIFSMLFGAGLILMYERAKDQDELLAGVYYRRTMLLIFFGFLHAYLIWWGDILFFYGVCGLFLFLFRKASVRSLLVVGGCLFLMNIPINMLQGFHLKTLSGEMAKITAKKEQEWKQISAMMAPSERKIQRTIEVYQTGSYGEIFKERAGFLLMFQPGGLFAFAFWRCGGLMLIGMALMRLGIFSGQRSRSFYVRMVALGYGIGIPIVAVGAYWIARSDWDPYELMLTGVHWNHVGSVPVSLGHVAVLMLVIQSGALQGLTERLRQVGRMAFTNYLMQSVVLTTVFYGYGFGLYGQVDRLGQWGFVVAMWVAQLWWSPLWLRHFRFGPAEWLWRTMTYGQVQPLRR